ncbi:flavin reductase family protein [Candidatus Micrarchaeota archaeon]|nr:flavin reductase family protein [Candidatus Micrarchaeota archaeon]
MERLYRMLYPARVCLITSRLNGKDNVMSASWVFPMSMDPPLFGVSVSPKRHSHGMIRGGRAFGINLPGPELLQAVKACGTISGRDGIDKFLDAGLTKEQGANVPLIRECLAGIECDVVQEIEAGDHTVFVGKAVNVVKRKEGKGLYQSADGFVEI